MTMMDKFDIKCSVCGKPSPQWILMSTNSFGYPDLDLRPPEMQRSTMNTWISECPHCGYVAADLEMESDVSKNFLESEEYLTCEGYDFKGKLSKLFYKSYLISKQNNNVYNCFFNLRNCAWDCDDHDDENAVAIRKQALVYLDEIIQTDDEEKNTFMVIKSDFLRRSGEFDQLINEYGDLTIGEEILDKIIRFEIEKALEKDTKCYTIEDVVG